MPITETMAGHPDGAVEIMQTMQLVCLLAPYARKPTKIAEAASADNSPKKVRSHEQIRLKAQDDIERGH